MNFTTDQREALNDEYSKLVHRNEQLENDLITLRKLYDNLMEQFDELQKAYETVR